MPCLNGVSSTSLYNSIRRGRARAAHPIISVFFADRRGKSLDSRPTERADETESENRAIGREQRAREEREGSKKEERKKNPKRGGHIGARAITTALPGSPDDVPVIYLDILVLPQFVTRPDTSQVQAGEFEQPDSNEKETVEK